VSCDRVVATTPVGWWLGRRRRWQGSVYLRLSRPHMAWAWALRLKRSLAPNFSSFLAFSSWKGGGEGEEK